MHAHELCTKAAEVVEINEEEYGGGENLRVIARLWNVYIEARLKSVSSDDAILNRADAATMMELMKIARRATGAHILDNYVDACGYAAIAGAAAEKGYKDGHSETR